jgi:uncharacterized membrane protein
MPLYPIPLILAVIIWTTIFISTGQKMMLGGLTVIGLGLVAFYVANKMNWLGKEEEVANATDEEA